MSWESTHRRSRLVHDVLDEIERTGRTELANDLPTTRRLLDTYAARHTRAIA
jgi:hypothetical protein